MIAVKHSRHKGFQVIKARLTFSRKAPLQASKRERKHGRDITWTLRAMPAPEWVVENWPGSATVIAVRGKGSRNGKPTDETRYYVTSLRTSAIARRASTCGRPCCNTCVTAGALRTPGTGPATPSSKRTRTATARSTAFRSWPRSGAWPGDCHERAAPRWVLVHHRGPGRPGSRHQGNAGAPGLARTRSGTELCLTSNEPGVVGSIMAI